MRMYIIINKLMKVITAIKLKYDLKNDLKMNNANSQKKKRFESDIDLSKYQK